MDAPAVAVTRDGKTLAAAWMDQRQGGNNRQVWWTGSVEKAESPIAEHPGGTKGHPSLAFDDSKILHAAWEDSRSGVMRIHARSTKSAARDTAISPVKGKASYPSVACGRDVGVAYEYEGNVVFSKVTD